MMNLHTDQHDVIHAFLKLSRAMRRCPPERKEYPFPPAVGRLLTCVASSPRISSRELCEIMDIRPSSLSEMTARAEADGLLIREADEADRRVQRLSLSEKGQAAVTDMENAWRRDAEKKTACLTEEEKVRFCEICGKLSEHLEKLALDLPEEMRREPHGCPGEPRGPHSFPDEPHGHRHHPPLPPGGRYRS